MGYLYFVRHGQTVWNVENKICGATDIALTDLGHQQAAETGKQILKMGISVDEILYSPLIRAAETARHISEITGVPAREEPRLTEQNFGKYESTPRDGKEFQKAKESFACRYEGRQNPCFSWHRGSIISWMNFGQKAGKRLIFWWPITGSPESSSPIFMR